MRDVSHRWHPVAGPLCAWLLAVTAAPPAFAFSVSYDQEARMGSQIVRSKVFLKDTRFRVESNVEGTATVVLSDGGRTYTYLPQQGIAMTMPSTDAAQQPIPSADDYLGYLKDQHAERTGSATVRGTSCEVYRFNDAVRGGTVTAWVDPTVGFPLRIQVEAPHQAMTMELSNVTLNPVLSDDLFRLPPGITPVAADEVTQQLRDLTQ